VIAKDTPKKNQQGVILSRERGRHRGNLQKRVKRCEKRGETKQHNLLLGRPNLGKKTLFCYLLWERTIDLRDEEVDTEKRLRDTIRMQNTEGQFPRWSTEGTSVEKT